MNRLRAKLQRLFHRHSYKVEVDGRACVLVPQGSTILRALIKAGVKYPHSCCMGDCGSCKSVLLTGMVQTSGYLESALSEAEAESGIFLPCSSKPLSDCKIAFGRKLNEALQGIQQCHADRPGLSKPDGE